MPSVAASPLAPTLTVIAVSVSRATLPGRVAVTVTVVALAASARLSGLADSAIAPVVAVLVVGDLDRDARRRSRWRSPCPFALTVWVMVVVRLSPALSRASGTAVTVTVFAA